MAPNTGRRGVLHEYTPKFTAFEHTPTDAPSQSSNILIFIGGLGDGLLTVPYTTPLSHALSALWTLAQLNLSSSYSGWGISTLQTDVAEISKAVSYFRSNKPGKIVIMGHSTGCQDVMEYLTGAGKEDREAVDGAIIQASVSDREALASFDTELQVKAEAAKRLIDEGKGDEILPYFETRAFYGNTPVTAARFFSLAGVGGDDDYFSTDLTDEQLEESFGSLPARTKFAILFSGADQYVGENVDRKALVERWIGVAKRGGGNVDEVFSGVIEGATHGLGGDEEGVLRELERRVLGFLEGV